MARIGSLPPKVGELVGMQVCNKGNQSDRTGRAETKGETCVRARVCVYACMRQCMCARAYMHVCVRMCDLAHTLSFLSTLIPFSFSIMLYDIHSSSKVSPTASCKHIGKFSFLQDSNKNNMRTKYLIKKHSLHCNLGFLFCCLLCSNHNEHILMQSKLRQLSRYDCKMSI